MLNANKIHLSIYEKMTQTTVLRLLRECVKSKKCPIRPPIVSHGIQNVEHWECLFRNKVGSWLCCYRFPLSHSTLIESFMHISIRGIMIYWNLQRCICIFVVSRFLFFHLSDSRNENRLFRISKNSSEDIFPKVWALKLWNEKNRFS